MGPFTSKSAVAQLTDHLREQILRDVIGETMPGINQLVRNLGVGTKTVVAAVAALEKEGLLENRGKRRSHRVLRNLGRRSAAGKKVTILMYEPSDRKTGYLVELIHRLESAGHEASFAPKTMNDLGMDQKRITRFVEGTETDAWLVVAGSKELLEWFLKSETPVFALFGRHRQLRIAGITVNKAAAYIELVDRLVAMGHRRIVNLVREEHRTLGPGFFDRLFLQQLSQHGIQTGAYNLPKWGNSPQGLHSLLDSLFQTTPPTALLLDEPMLLISARDHLARQGIIAPENISMACCDADSSFDWCLPQVTHMRWDSRLIVQSVVKWVDKIARGKDDQRKSTSKADLVVGGTIGPTPKSGS